MMQSVRLGFLIVVVLLGMASNSLLARAALGNHWIDPLSFTVVRLASGAIILLVLSLVRKKRPLLYPLMPFMLWIYAMAFAYGYVKLGAATGTLFLFFAIQAGMLGWEIRLGYQLSRLQWTGSGLTLLGLWLLVGNAAHVPSLSGTILMLCAGMAWAAYSVLGRQSRDNLASTTANFLYAALGAMIIYIVFSNGYSSKLITQKGLIFAIVSGAFSSALIYVLWYSLMKKLSGTTSAVIQMFIPVIVAAGAVPLLNEPLSQRLIGAGVVMISGILMVTLSKKSIQGKDLK